MTVLNDTWRFLVQRKLWPMAILLVAAAAAVPMLLAKEPATPPAAAIAAVKSKDSTLTTEPIVAPAGTADRSGRRHVLGSPKDPFEPNATPTPTPTPQSVQAPSLTTSGGLTSAGGGTSAPVGTTGSPGGTLVAPGSTTPLAPVTPQKKYELFELTVRFGASEETATARRDVKRLGALPSVDEPVLIYLGVLKDHKTAVFMVDSGVVAQGDGDCKPSRNTCETIHLKEGETEFFDVPSETESTDGAEPTSAAQYQLDVVKIRKQVTTSAKQARKSIARVSRSGQKIVRARILGDGPLRYHFNKRTGRLEKLSHKAYRAVVAKAAKAARAHF
jgi:hypothetical protein